jgi:hypothetical protein
LNVSPAIGEKSLVTDTSLPPWNELGKPLFDIRELKKLLRILSAGDVHNPDESGMRDL